MPANRRSRLITQGVARSPNRAMLRAVGFGDADFEKPIVGVANGHSTMNPCNAGIQPLVDRAMAALADAGAMPQVFGVPTVTDGIGMGTEGMKYSLVSREVIADAIETSVNGQCMDGVLVVGGCDKNMPAGMMAMARINVPAIYVYAGTIKPGHWKGQTLTIVSPFEAVGAYAAGKLSKEDYDGIERNACPTVGACGGMYTANTMSSSFEALGMSLLGSSQLASPDAREGRLVGRVGDGARARDRERSQAARHHHARVDRERDIAGDGDRRLDERRAALPGDRVRGRSADWTIDDFERIRKRVPVLCDLKPSGRYVAVDFNAAGGVPQVLRMLLDAGLLQARLHDDHRAHARRRARSRCRRAARRPGRHPADRQAAVCAGPPRDPARQPRARRLRREDHRAQESGDHRPCARVRLRARVHGGDHGASRSAPATSSSSAMKVRKAAPACRKCWRRRRR